VTVLALNIEESLRIVRERMLAACVRSHRAPEGVRLLAVTKRVEAPRVREAFSLGQNNFGENYVQEARQKIGEVGPGPMWHMIGHVQLNKAKYIPRLFDYVHTVDRWELLEALDGYGKELSVLFEVNLSGETQKHGTTKDGLKGMLERAGGLRAVKPAGLMTVPPFSDDPEESRPVFGALREMLHEMNKEFGLDMKELSMGMSGDFEVAIEEGATMIRVGTAIFGERT
jgi:pyridoxal phosphate enzyme (YggS family)